MKKLILVVLLSIGLTAFAQKNINEGKITQKQTYSSSNAAVSAQLAMIGDVEITTYFKGNKSRSELSNPMTGDVTSIIDNDTKKMMMLMNNPQLGKKYTTTDITISEEDKNNMTITPKDETKEILGYKCKRYDVSLTKKGVETTMIMYTTDKLAALSEQTASFSEEVKGYPMKIEISANQSGMDITITMEVTAIAEEKIDDAKFSMDVPDGYEEMPSMN